MVPAKKMQGASKTVLATVKNKPKASTKHTINLDTEAFNDFRLIQQKVSSFLGFRVTAQQTLRHIMAKYPNTKMP